MNVGPRDRRTCVPVLLSLALVGVGCASGATPDKAILGGSLAANGSGEQNMSGGDGSASGDATQGTGDDGSPGGPASGDDSGSGTDGASATDDGGRSTGDDGGGGKMAPASTLNCSKSTPCNGFTYVPSNFDPTRVHRAVRRDDRLHRDVQLDVALFHDGIVLGHCAPDRAGRRGVGRPCGRHPRLPTL